MIAFEWANPATVEEAVALLAPGDAKTDPDEVARPFAGGQDLLTTMKSYIVRPPRVVNLKTIAGLDHIQGNAATGVKIGALATLNQLAEHPEIQKNYPGLSEAALSIATPQIRNLGTVGGNLCQRSRCWYYRLENYKCLKKGGTECFAASGENKYNAIFGDGPSFFVHPSDLAPMLIAFGASITVTGRAGSRQVPLEEFFTLPKVDARRENILKDGEIITEVQLPPSSSAARSTYLKFKERESLDFAMSAVAIAVEMGADKTVHQARIVLGGVAPIPWRAPKAEAALTGKPLTGQSIANAAELALDGASPLEKNQYKVPLTKTLVRRALAKVNA